MILFVTGTGTGVGKTVVTRALTYGLIHQRCRVLTVKPLETGCTPEPLDALALAQACGRPDLADVPGFYRVAPPLAPYAATLAGEAEPDLDAILNRCRHLAAETDVLIVEGAGGLLVPLDATRTMAELALALGSTVLLVAPDRLGVLSDALATLECARQRSLPIAGLVLNRGAAPADPSRAHNAQILAERAACPVFTFEACESSETALRTEASRSGLTERVRARMGV